MGWLSSFADDVLGLDDSGGILGSASKALADFDDAIGQKITRPIGDALKNEAINAIVKVTLHATGQGWAVPIVDAATVAAYGGDWKDALEAGAKSYVTQQIAMEAGKFAGEAATAMEYGVPIGSQQAAMLAQQSAGLSTLASAASAAASRAVIAGAYDQDPLQAALAGAVQAGAPHLMGDLKSYFSGSSSGPGDVAGPGGVMDSVKGLFGGQDTMLGGLDKQVQSAIADAAMASIQGKPVDQALINSVIQSSNIVGNIVGGVVSSAKENGVNVNLDTQNLMADALYRSVSALTQGRDVGDAVNAAITSAGIKAMNQQLASLQSSAWDEIKSAYASVENTAKKYYDDLTNYNKAVESRESTVDYYKDLQGNANKAYKTYEKAYNEYQRGVRLGYDPEDLEDLENEVLKAQGRYESALGRYQNYDVAAVIDRKNAAIESAAGKVEKSAQAYNDSMPVLQDLATKTAEITGDISKNFNVELVNEINPEFDPDAYRSENNLAPDVDPYQHYLGQGISSTPDGSGASEPDLGIVDNFDDYTPPTTPDTSEPDTVLPTVDVVADAEPDVPDVDPYEVDGAPAEDPYAPTTEEPGVDYSLVPKTDTAPGLEEGDLGTGLDVTLPPVEDVEPGEEVDYSLTPDGTEMGGEGLKPPTMPDLDSMGGGQGLTVPVEGGKVGELGFTPDDAVPVLGDPDSFINDPDVLGKPVIQQGTTSTETPEVKTVRKYLQNKVTGGSGSTGGSGGGSGATSSPSGGYNFFDNPFAFIAGAYDADEETEDTQTTSSAAPYSPATLFNPLGNASWAPQTKIGGLGFAGKFINKDDDTYYLGKDQEERQKKMDKLKYQQGWLTDEERAALMQDQGAPSDDLSSPYYNFNASNQNTTDYSAATPYFAAGGLIGHNPEFYSEGGASLGNRYVKGDGDGTSDSVPAMLASGEFVIPADVVSSLGNGDNDAGALVLDNFMAVIRKHKRSAHHDDLPPDSRGPLEYLSMALAKSNGKRK